MSYWYSTKIFVTDDEDGEAERAERMGLKYDPPVVERDYTFDLRQVVGFWPYVAEENGTEFLCTTIGFRSGGMTTIITPYSQFKQDLKRVTDCG
jgi:hypothetical protein